MANKESDPFLRIPKRWEPLIGMPIPQVKKNGTPRQKTRGGAPAFRPLDLYDLALIDEIRSFSERGGKICFADTHALAKAAMLSTDPQSVNQRVLQLICFGIIKHEYRVIEIRGTPQPRLCLSVNADFLEELIADRLSERQATAEAEVIRLSRGGKPAHTPRISSEAPGLQEYLQEYIQEQGKEDGQKLRQDQAQDHVHQQHKKCFGIPSGTTGSTYDIGAASVMCDPLSSNSYFSCNSEKIAVSKSSPSTSKHAPRIVSNDAVHKDSFDRQPSSIMSTDSELLLLCRRRLEEIEQRFSSFPELKLSYYEILHDDADLNNLDLNLHRRIQQAEKFPTPDNVHDAIAITNNWYISYFNNRYVQNVGGDPLEFVPDPYEKNYFLDDDDLPFQQCTRTGSGSHPGWPQLRVKC